MEEDITIDKINFLDENGGRKYDLTDLERNLIRDFNKNKKNWLLFGINHDIIKKYVDLIRSDEIEEVKHSLSNPENYDPTEEDTSPSLTYIDPTPIGDNMYNMDEEKYEQHKNELASSSAVLQQPESAINNPLSYETTSPYRLRDSLFRNTGVSMPTSIPHRESSTADAKELIQAMLAAETPNKVAKNTSLAQEPVTIKDNLSLYETTSPYTLDDSWFRNTGLSLAQPDLLTSSQQPVVSPPATVASSAVEQQALPAATEQKKFSFGNIFNIFRSSQPPVEEESSPASSAASLQQPESESAKNDPLSYETTSPYTLDESWFRNTGVSMPTSIPHRESSTADAKELIQAMLAAETTSPYTLDESWFRNTGVSMPTSIPSSEDLPMYPELQEISSTLSSPRLQEIVSSNTSDLLESRQPVASSSALLQQQEPVADNLSLYDTTSPYTLDESWFRNTGLRPPLQPALPPQPVASSLPAAVGQFIESLTPQKYLNLLQTNPAQSQLNSIPPIPEIYNPQNDITLNKKTKKFYNKLQEINRENGNVNLLFAEFTPKELLAAQEVDSKILSQDRVRYILSLVELLDKPVILADFDKMPKNEKEEVLYKITTKMKEYNLWIKSKEKQQSESAKNDSSLYETTSPYTLDESWFINTGLDTSLQPALPPRLLSEVAPEADNLSLYETTSPYTLDESWFINTGLRPPLQPALPPQPLESSLPAAVASSAVEQQQALPEATEQNKFSFGNIFNFFRSSQPSVEEEPLLQESSAASSAASLQQPESAKNDPLSYETTSPYTLDESWFRNTGLGTTQQSAQVSTSSSSTSAQPASSSSSLQLHLPSLPPPLLLSAQPATSSSSLQLHLPSLPPPLLLSAQPATSSSSSSLPSAAAASQGSPRSSSSSEPISPSPQTTAFLSTLKREPKPLLEKLTDIKQKMPSIYYITQYGEILFFTTDIVQITDRPPRIKLEASLIDKPLAKYNFENLISVGYPEITIFQGNVRISLTIDQFAALRGVINTADKWKLISEDKKLRPIDFYGKWLSYNPGADIDMQKLVFLIQNAVNSLEIEEEEYKALTTKKEKNKALELLKDKAHRLLEESHRLHSDYRKEYSNNIPIIQTYLKRMQDDPSSKQQLEQQIKIFTGDIIRRVESIDKIDKQLKDAYDIDLDFLNYLATKKDEPLSKTSSAKPRGKKSSPLKFYKYEGEVVDRLTPEQLAAPDTFSERALYRRDGIYRM
jgi:hypothetical protein